MNKKIFKGLNVLKKLLTAYLILIVSTSSCFATNAFIYIAPAVALNNITTSDNSFRGISPKLGLGFAAEYADGLYIAGEVNAMAGVWQLENNTDDDDDDGTNDPDDNSAKIQSSYAASILPGIMFSENTLGFLRIGVVTSHFSGPDQNSTGGEIGAGLQTAIRNCWYIRGEYIYSFYESVGDLNAPKEDTFALGVVYTF